MLLSVQMSTCELIAKREAGGGRRNAESSELVCTLCLLPIAMADVGFSFLSSRGHRYAFLSFCLILTVLNTLSSLQYATSRAGFFTVIFLLLVLSAITDWTIRLIVTNANLSVINRA